MRVLDKVLHSSIFDGLIRWENSNEMFIGNRKNRTLERMCKKFYGFNMNDKHKKLTPFGMDLHMYEYRSLLLLSGLKVVDDKLLATTNFMNKSNKRDIKGLFKSSGNDLLIYILGVMQDRRYYALRKEVSPDGVYYEFLGDGRNSMHFDNAVCSFRVKLSKEITNMTKHFYNKFKRELIKIGFLMPVYQRSGYYYLNINYFMDWIANRKLRFLMDRYKHNIHLIPVMDEYRCYMLGGHPYLEERSANILELSLECSKELYGWYYKKTLRKKILKIYLRK